MISDPLFYMAAVPAILLAGIAKGGFGSGAGLFATPLIALTMPIPQAAAFLLPILCLMDLAGLWAYRGLYSRENLRLLFLGGFIGVALGAVTFRYLDDAWIRLGLGLMSVVFVLHRYLRADGAATAARSTAKGLLWSSISGFASTIAHAGGPPLAVYLLPQRLDKAVMVGTSVVFLAVLNFVKIVPYAWLGLFDARNFSTSVALAPLAPVGIWLGIILMRRLPEALFYRVCYGILLGVGVKLVWDGIAGL